MQETDGQIKRRRYLGQKRTKSYRALKKLKLLSDTTEYSEVTGYICQENLLKLQEDNNEGEPGEPDITDDQLSQEVLLDKDISINNNLILQNENEYFDSTGEEEETVLQDRGYDANTDSSETYSVDDESDEGGDGFDFNYVDTKEDHVENYVPIKIQQLRDLGAKMTQTNLDELLKILRPRLLPTLPKSAKTFLQTVNAKYAIFPMCDIKGGKGEFVYFSIKKSLEEIVNPEIHEEKKIELQISVDGVPLKKSNDDQFWVTSAKLHFYPDVYKVFPVAIFFGTGKPKCEDYIDNFIQEINELHKDGIFINGVKFSVQLKCIIADTPARAFLKKTLGHRGKESCERCETVGETIEKTTVFPSTDSVERTDESFRSFHQENHHHGPTPLSLILPAVNLVFLCILDFMHLFCIGIMKKLLDFWISGNKSVRLDVKAKDELNRRLECIKSNIPLEFQRKTRSISSIAKWKATELRFFLLYCGPVILRKLLDENLYNHFLLLHVAARILCSESFCRVYNRHADCYLRAFFSSMAGFYGSKSQTLNVHHLIHVSRDVLSMNCNLSRITAFAFESFLGKLKRLLRTPNRPLAQVCRRLYERQSLQSKTKVQIPQPIEIMNMLDENNLTKIRFKEFTVTNESPDNTVILNNGKIASVKKMFIREEIIMLQCQIWKIDKPLYTNPTSSGKFSMWQLHSNPTNKIIELEVTKLSTKLIKLELPMAENEPVKVYVIPFLH